MATLASLARGAAFNCQNIARLRYRGYRSAQLLKYRRGSMVSGHKLKSGWPFDSNIRGKVRRKRDTNIRIGP